MATRVMSISSPRFERHILPESKTQFRRILANQGKAGHVNHSIEQEMREHYERGPRRSPRHRNVSDPHIFLDYFQR